MPRPLLFLAALMWLAGLPAAESISDLLSRFAAVEKGTASPEERRSLISAAVQTPGEPSVQILASLAADRCRRIREEAVRAFQGCQAERMPGLIRNLAGQRAAAARAGAVFAVVSTEGWKALDHLAQSAGESGGEAVPIRLAVATALAALDHDPSPKATERATAIAIALAGDRDLGVRLAAIGALGKRGRAADAQRALEALAVDPVEEVARRALEALLAVGAEAGRLSAAVASRLRTSTDIKDRIVLVNALGRIGGTASANALVDALAVQGNSGIHELRAAICDALGQIACTDPALVKRCDAVLPALAVRERWSGVKLAAVWALLRMRSQLAVPTAIAAMSRQDDEDLIWLLQQHTVMTFTERMQWQAWWQTAGPTWRLPDPSAIRAVSAVDFYEVRDSTEEVAFVIDVSGSMREPKTLAGEYGKPETVTTKLEAAKGELWRSLRALEPGTRVSLVWFSSMATTWGDGPVLATWRNKARMRDAFAGIPPRGATNAWAALAAALDRPGVASIYFLTDGQPTVGESTDATVIAAEMLERNWNRPERARIHALAFHIQADAGDGERAKERAKERRAEQERRARAAGKQAPPEDAGVEVARTFLRRLSADSGGMFREVR